jgi:hypothetical protein
MSRKKKKPYPRPIAPDCEWPPARIAALRRAVFKKMRKFRNSEERRRMLAKEKTLDLAVEGSSDAVILGEDPGAPETPAPAVVPDRPRRPSGMTVFMG